MDKRNFLARIILAFAFFLIVFVSSVSGNVNPPSFPSCLNPQGTVKASYNSGTHGVPGDATSYQGSDTVYSVSENSLIQCLCTDSGEGIQTNWWKASSLSSQEIESLKTQGWVFIPDGSAWGLEATSYLAKNSKYACRGAGGAGEVLGLAATGNIKLIYTLIFIGLLSMMFGHLLKSRGSK